MHGVKVERLPDGRIGVTLNGESAGFYAWFDDDARRIISAVLEFYSTEVRSPPEPNSDIA